MPFAVAFDPAVVDNPAGSEFGLTARLGVYRQGGVLLFQRGGLFGGNDGGFIEAAAGAGVGGGGCFRISVNFYLCKHAQLVASGIDDIQDVDPHSKLFDAVVYDEVLHNDFPDSARVPRLIVDAFAAFRQCREVFHLHIEHIKISSRGIRGKQSIGNIAAQPAEIIRSIGRYDDFIQIHSNRGLV